MKKSGSDGRRRFLLYLDILGFRDLVKSSNRVMELYYIINSLSVHKDAGFKTIVFSDTLLVYNSTAIPESNRWVEAMFLCEYVQQLLHRTAGRDFSFRGLISYGEFRVEQMENLNAFFGRALVAAYDKERSIKCPGLFIDDYCNRYNLTFSTRRHSEDCSFVYLLPNLEKLDHDLRGSAYPVAGDVIFDTGIEYYLSVEIHILEDIHSKMVKHRDPGVRSKFAAAWKYYHQQMPGLLDALVAGKFNPKSILRFDWRKAEAQYQRDRRETYRSKIWTGPRPRHLEKGKQRGVSL